MAPYGGNRAGAHEPLDVAVQRVVDSMLAMAPVSVLGTNTTREE